MGLLRCLHCSVCSFVFLIGILAHFSGLAAPFSSGSYILFSSIPPTPHSVDPEARGATPGALRAAGRLRGAVRTRGESLEGAGSAPARRSTWSSCCQLPRGGSLPPPGTHFVSIAAPAMQGAAGWASRVGNPSPPTLGALCALAGPTRTPGVSLIRPRGARLPGADGQQL